MGYRNSALREVQSKDGRRDDVLSLGNKDRRDLLGLALYAVQGPRQSEQKLMNIFDHISHRLDRHNKESDELMQSFGVHSTQDMRLPSRPFANQAGLVNCPNCGAAVSGPQCSYCNTVFNATGARIQPIETDEFCPNCGNSLNVDDLFGDGLRIRRVVHCSHCPWEDTYGRRN